ncbi:MAG: hypothetical protein OXL36_20840 [Bryobacterales bacterium]|nr:hypothetical protein [Bryobacterales bacterium]MDE0294996.1 hypothetical protein [Bryobacterales bacterium]
MISMRTFNFAVCIQVRHTVHDGRRIAGSVVFEKGVDGPWFRSIGSSAIGDIKRAAAMTKTFVSLGLLFCMFTAQSVKGNRDHSSDYEPVTRYGPSRDASKDMAYALEDTRQSDRMMLLDIGG